MNEIIYEGPKGEAFLAEGESCDPNDRGVTVVLINYGTCPFCLKGKFILEIKDGYEATTHCDNYEDQCENFYEDKIVRSKMVTDIKRQRRWG